jgi:hypothetical protein
MQHFVQDSCRLPLFDHDAYLIDTADILPAIILDFIYGIVAYQHWKSNEDPPNTLLRYFDEQHYKLALHRAPRIPIDDFDSGWEDVDDESKDPTYVPPRNTRKGGKRNLQDAMDEVLEVSFMIQLRMTPQEELVRLQQQELEIQSRERDASRMKVEEWRRTISEKSSNPLCVA